MLSFNEVIRIFFLATISFGVAFLIAPLLLRFLTAHKCGKPTMGGILIWGTVLIVTFFSWFFSWLDGPFFDALNFLSRPQTYLPLGALAASALVGLVDDLFNIRRIGPNRGGLRMRHRLLLYGFIALIGALWFYFKLDWDVLHIPYVGTYALGLWYIPVFIFIIVATG